MSLEKTVFMDSDEVAAFLAAIRERSRKTTTNPGLCIEAPRSPALSATRLEKSDSHCLDESKV
jgi:hypothetical protein